MMFKKFLLGAAAVGAAVGLSACSSNNSGSSKGPTTVTWSMPGTPIKDLKSVNNTLNKYLVKKYNLKLDLRVIDWGEYGQKMNAQVNAGDPFDLIFAAPWSFSYVTNARKGAYLDLTKYLNGEVKKLKNELSSIFWKGATIDNKIYGVPSQGSAASTDSFIFNKALVDKYKIPYKEITTYAKLEPYLKMIKEKEGITPWYVPNSFLNPTNFDTLSDSLGIELDGDTTKITTYYRTKAYLDKLKDMRKFNQEGYIPKDASMRSLTDIKDKDWFVTCGMAFGPVVSGLQTAKDQLGKDVVYTPMTDFVVKNSSTTGSITAVGANTTHPKEAVKMLEVVNTDPYVANMLAYGIKGKHYKMTGKTAIDFLPEHKNYIQNKYMLGNSLLFYTMPGEPTDLVAKTKAANAKTPESPALGFNFDSSKYNRQIASMNNVFGEYNQLINTGSVDVDSTMKKMDAKLKAAGIDDVIKGMQQQYDTWRKENKK
jgi:putative aldouronate transport system substrate-binding protein